MDRRETQHQWWERFDETRMTLYFGDNDGEEMSAPAKFEVCGTCDGKGSHVNPSIDSHGLSREDFDDDPEFAEGYFRGDYDQPCNECHGRRVVPVVDEQSCAADVLAVVNERIDSHYEDQREQAHERRYGY